MINKGHTIFVVAGRLPKSLVKSKVEPIVKSKIVERVYVFSQEEGFKIDGLKYITLPKIFNSRNFLLKFLRIIYEPLQLFIYCLKYKPDFIKGIYVMPKGFNGLIISRIYGCKCMVSNIGGLPEILTYYNNFKKLRKKINLYIYKKADLVTTKGYTIIDYLIKNGVNKNKIHVYNGSIDTKKFKRDKNIKKSIDVLFVGSFIERKGPDRVIEIIKILINKYNFSSIKVGFLGKGELYELVNKQIINEGLQNNIKLYGHRDNTADYFVKSKVLIMPSISEGLSTAMLEAMSSECVPVVSDVGEMTKAAVDGRNSFVIKKYNDFLGFAKKINILLSDNLKRNKMASNAREDVLKEYSIDEQMNQFEVLIRKILS